MSNLPTLKDLNANIETAFKNDQFNLLLNQKPMPAWVKDHPFAKNVKYIPIERIEFLLTKIFQQWKLEVLSYQQLFNSVAVHVRLHYLNPVDGQWYYHDGLGAVGIQTDAGKAASDMNAIKQDAVMKALPAAESYALKDAAEKLGVLFGKDLNRKETLPFTITYTDDKQHAKERERLLLLIKEATNIYQLNQYHENAVKYGLITEFEAKLKTLTK